MRRIRNLLSMGLLFGSFTLSSATTYVIAYGINNYPTPVDRNDKPVLDDDGNPIDLKLRGCVNDAKNWVEHLRTRGVSVANSSYVLDENVDGQGFVSSLKKVVGRLKPGDHLILCFSGHGYRLEDDSRPSGYQETIVLQDLSLVTDDQFKIMADSLNGQGIHTTFMFDSCHAGGMTQSVPRYVSVRRKSATGLLVKPRVAVKSFRTAVNLRAKAKPGNRTAGDFAMLAACRDDQTSADVTTVEGVSGGAFSMMTLGMLNDNPTTGLKSLLEQVSDALKEARFTQTPSFNWSPDVRGDKPIIFLAAAKAGKAKGR